MQRFITVVLVLVFIFGVFSFSFAESNRLTSWEKKVAERYHDVFQKKAIKSEIQKSDKYRNHSYIEMIMNYRENLQKTSYQ